MSAVVIRRRLSNHPRVPLLPLCQALLLAACACHGAAWAQAADPAPAPAPASTAGSSTSAAAARAAPPAATNSAAEPETLRPITVRETRGVEPDQLPGVLPGGQVARGARLGTLGNVDVFTTPFAMRAYTAELAQNQGARYVDELVANDPSVRISSAPGHVLDQSTIRGFLVTMNTYRFDGLPGLFSYSRVVVPNFERLEILKGPSTSVYGGGAGVGGTINLVPKRATAEPVRSVSVGYTSKSMREAHVDLGQRFGPDGMFGARLNLYGEKGTLAVGTQRESVMPQLALDLRTSRVRLNLDAGAGVYETHGVGLNYTLAPGQPVPRVPDPRHRNAPLFTSMKEPNRFALLGGEFDINDALTGYARVGRYHEKAESVYPIISPLRGDGSYTVNLVGFNTWSTDNKVADVGLRGRFATGALAHQMTVSALRFENLYAVAPGGQVQAPAGGFVPTPGNVYTDYPLRNPYAGGFPQGLVYSGTPVVQSSVGVADSITALDDRLNVVVGLRRQEIRAGAYDGQRNAPTLAASWKLTPAWTVYGNYATALVQGAQAPVGSSNAGQSLPPYIGRQVEGGLKWNAGRFGMTLAAFQIRQASAFIDPADNTFKAAGEQRNRGVELETFGELRPGIRLLGGLALIDARQTHTLRGATDGKRALGVARPNLNLGGEWDVPGVPGLTATGRAIYTGDTYVDAANTQRLPSATRLDAGVRYALPWQGRKVVLRAGVTNLTDRANWQASGRNLLIVAEPRTWRISATFEL